MSGQPRISHADVGRYFALLQPPLIGNRLLEDTVFRAEFGLPSRDAISFGGGPAILKATLYDGVRKLFTEQRPQFLTAVTGDTITITLGGDDIALLLPAAEAGATSTVYPRNLMFLSPSADVRQAALQRTINELGPTGPDPVYWQKELQHGALDDERMDDLSSQIDAAIVPNMARVTQDIMTGVLDKHHLVPRSLSYWEALCGAPQDGIDQETWLREIFLPHRQRLIERDLVRGVDLCLCMGIRDDLTLRSLTAHISHDDLWNALEQLKPIDDPFSLLGIVDLATSRSAEDDRFVGLGTQTVERLCAAQLCRADGVDVYSFLPALIELVRAELQVTPSIAVRPAYWRRICAWTQAALLVRAFQAVSFDPEQFSENIGSLLRVEAQTAEFLDLRQLPLSQPGETSGYCIHAEILGRLLILQKRETEQGRELPGTNALTQAFAEQAESAPLMVHMPGPLELHRWPSWRQETLTEEFQADLQQRADGLTSEFDDENLFRFLYLSRLVLFNKYIIHQLSKFAAGIRFGTSDEERRAAVEQLGRLSYVALAQRNVALANAILTRCLQAIGSETDEHFVGALVHIGFVATAASGQDSVSKERLAKYLRDLAFLLPQGAPCRALCAELEVLKTFTPLGDWHSFAQAEALCRLGS